MSIVRRSRSLLTLTTTAAVVAGLAAVVAPPATAAPAPRAVATVTAGADPGDVWTEVSERPQARRGGLTQRVAPSDYTAYHLDLGALAGRLDRAPSEAAKAAPLRVKVPAPNGELVEFAVAESPVMEPGLAAAHPDITTYAGTTTGSAPASIRLDVTPMGFHASVRGPGASWYVDPAYNGTGQGRNALYLSYDGADLPARDRTLIEPEKSGMAKAARRAAARVAGAPRVGEGGGAVAIQRTYRLALVTDPSYAAYFGTTSDSVITAEKVTLMNRVNQVYGDDLSVRMLLIAGNDALNFNTDAQFLGTDGRCGATACYTTNDVGCGDVIDTNRFVVGQIIGADKYDIGHIMFGPDGDGGGVAYLGAVGTDIKAGGCTGLNPPTGDGFAIDYVAHEMGHQFSGNHTFNGTTGSCASSNRNAGTSVEPGSGVTVMAYAGICGVDNLQPHSDPYFSQRSQTEIAAFTRSTPSNLQEIQNVALSGFGTGESFTVTYPGGTPQTVPFASYTATGLKAALEAAEPSSATATIGGYWGAGTVVLPTLTNGFQVTWSGTADVPTPTVTVATGTFSAIVGTTDNGGPEGMNGFQNPTPTGNHNPTVVAPPAKTIPQRTPFQLTGSATDVDGDQMVYLWEQNNTGGTTGTGLNSNTKTSGPLFRVFGTYANVTSAGTEQYNSPGLNIAGTSPTRSFPDAAQVAAGETNAATGTCPTYTGTGGTDTAALRCFSEFLPVQTATTRSMSFRLTARDLGGTNGGSDGGTSFADTAITVGTAGPFLMTSQPTASSVTGNAAGTVTWNVASTNTATYATNVKISFSTDGGLTFPTVLAASTPNDGTEAIAWPNVATTQGRVKVEAVDNYFYDVNDGAITITPSTTTPTLTTGGNAAGATFTAASSDALATTPVVTASSSSVDGTAITGTASGLPSGLSLTRTTSSAAGDRPGTTRFEVTGTANVDPGSYPVTVTVGDGAAANQVVSFTVVVAKDTATLTYTGDTTGATGTRTVSVTVADTDATPGTPAGTVVFTDQTSGDTLCSTAVVSGAASCTFSAPATRTYQVVATLTSTRYTGASAPASLVVTAPAPAATLTTGGNADGATFTAASSDALSTTPVVTASASAVDGTAITGSASGLPSGLSLTRTTSSAAGDRPGTTRFEVLGTADVDPGSYPVVVTVSDGAGNAADTTVSFTVVVAKDTATLTYTGDTTGATGTRTVSVTVADTDATPGTPTGTVAFTDQTTGDTLCSATVAAGAASCTFSAPATRTYQVVATLTSTRYTGASAPASLVVTAPAPADTLTTGGNAAGATFTAASSDALSTTPVVTASATAVDGTAITASPSGLPAGLSLVRTASSAAGTRPGTTRFEVTGTADAGEGSYPVVVTVSDGAGGAADTTVSFTVVVVKDTATLTYTGETSGATGARTVSVSVADTDPTPGTPAGTVVFTDQTTGDTLCSATVAAGSASCAFNAPATRTYQVVGTLSSTRYTGSSAPASLVVTAPTTPPDPPTPPADTLTTGGNATDARFDAASSDALSTTPVITAQASAVDGGSITASASGLPTGLSLVRTESSSAGTRPGTTRFEVTGTADVDPGTYPVVVTVSDGAGGAADRTVSFRVVVTQDSATLTYTGDTTEKVGSVTVSVTVADTDATPGTPTGTVAFTDRTTGDTLCLAAVASGAASCDFSADVPRTYQVVATLSGTRYSGTSAPASLVVSAPEPVDTTAPETTITSGPAQSGTALGADVDFAFGSEEGATFGCTLNGTVVECADGTLTLTQLPAGTYDLYVAATDAAGNTDASPVRRRFYVPVDDTRLRIVKGTWQRVERAGYFRETFASATKRTSTLSYDVVGATSLALVLSNAQKFGAVDIYLDDEKLVTISAKGTARTLRIAAIDTFSSPRSGTLRIVSRSDAEVRIDGLIVRTTAFTPLPLSRHSVLY